MKKELSQNLMALAVVVMLEFINLFVLRKTVPAGLFDILSLIFAFLIAVFAFKTVKCCGSITQKKRKVTKTTKKKKR